MAVNISSGFNITTNEAVDSRMIKSKAEMRNMTAAELTRMPDKYFCICSDDGKLYFFNKNNTFTPETGYFRIIDDTIAEAIEKSEVVKEQVTSAVEDAIEHNEGVQEQVEITIQNALETGVVTVPIATETIKGTVVSSTDEKNKVSVDDEGKMEVNQIGVEKITNSEGVKMIFRGGSATINV